MYPALSECYKTVNAMSDAVTDILGRVENFVTIRYVNLLTNLALLLATKMMVFTFVVTAYTAVYLANSATKSSWTFFCKTAMRTFILMASNIAVTVIDSKNFTASFEKSLQSITVTVGVLIIAYALPKQSKALVDRTILLTTYIFVDSITDLLRNVDVGIPTGIVGMVGLIVLDFIVNTQSNNSFVFVMRAISLLTINLVFTLIPDTKIDVQITLSVAMVYFVSVLAQLSHNSPLWHQALDYAVYTAATSLTNISISPILAIFISSLLIVWKISNPSLFKHDLQRQFGPVVDLQVLVCINSIVNWVNKNLVAVSSYENTLLLLMYVIIAITFRHLLTARTEEQEDAAAAE